MKANQAIHSVGTMCRVLKISRSGYYAWCKRPMSPRARRDLWLRQKIEVIHRDSRGVYGSPMIHAELVVGWSMQTHLRTELILEALRMALVQRQPRRGVIHHSDPGCQYTSYAFGKRCQEAGVMPSVGSVGDAYDNAMAESFFATLERELLSRRRFRSQAEAKMAVFAWLEGWYNRRRRHSALGYRSPANYERAHQRIPALDRTRELLTPPAPDCAAA